MISRPPPDCATSPSFARSLHDVLKSLPPKKRVPLLLASCWRTATPDEYEVTQGASGLIWARPDQKPPATSLVRSGWCSAGAARARPAPAPNGSRAWRWGSAAYRQRPPPAASRSSARRWPCARRDDRGRLRAALGPHALASGRPGRRRGGGSNGPMARSRRPFRPRIRKACAGPQFDAAWSDELAKWRHLQETWDMLQFGLRLGARPRQVVTTTPRPIPLLKRLLADPQWRSAGRRHGPTRQPRARLPRRTCQRRYAGTRLGRQETRRRDRRGARRCALDAAR